MKAIVTTRYGSPEVLQLQEVAKPVPKDNELLVKVHAAAVGPSDCAFRKGDPFLVKLIYGLRKPKHPIGGSEFAGEVEAVGEEVKSFKPGDQVIGLSPGFGAHAEYLCIKEKEPLTFKPANLTFEESVAVCDGSPTALTFLRDVAKLQRGQKVLINGASGAVGSAAVQLAKYFGAEVTGVCSTVNIEMVKSLGADYVIDYTQVDFTRTGQTYDVIFDAIGKSSFSKAKRALTRNGVYMTTVPALIIVPQMLWTALFSRKKAKFATAGLMQSKQSFTYLKELAEAGILKAVIDRCYPLEQTAEAHRYVDTERKKGNVVILIGDRAPLRSM